jgi:formylglycine-generating enzyme required for sulfatase activity
VTRLLLPALCLAALLLPGLDAAPTRVAKGPPRELVNSLGMRLVHVPAGTFLMGSPATEAGRYHDEHAHLVEISRAFYLGAHEVTQEQYRRVTGRTPSYFAAGGAGKARVRGLDTRNFPVETVSWHDAVAFCQGLADLPAEKRARRTYRLPTEAEWEYACRAGAATPFSFGPALTSLQANFNGSFPYGGAAKGPSLRRTAPVGSYRPSTWGLHDMHGSVWEWCADWYAEDYYKTSPKKDPKGPAEGDTRVMRGGSWFGQAALCRAAHRLWANPDTRNKYTGFRVVCVVGPAR